MKIIHSILFLFLPLLLICQTKDSIHSKKNEIGITFSPDYSYRTLKADASNIIIKDMFDTLEVPKFSYTVGLNFIHKLNKRLFVSVGFLLSDKGEKTKKNIFIQANNYVNHYYYLDIPLKINYNLIHKKNKLFINAGLSSNLFLIEKTTTLVGNESKKNAFNNEQTLSAINYAFIAGFGVNCPLTDKWDFKLEPVYRRSITPILNAPVKKYLYSFGLNFGFYYQF